MFHETDSEHGRLQICNQPCVQIYYYYPISFLMEYQTVRINMNNLISNGQIVDDTNGRDDIESKGD